jgi:phosphoribosylformylglycinamidine synthase subunit PurQ / glutaminase
VTVVVERAETPFTTRCRPGQELVIPVKHGEGAYHLPPDLPDEQVVLRYLPEENPNGSDADIAGVTNAESNVFGLMPHPEHAVDPLLGSGDGGLLLASLVDSARERLYARA